MPHRVAQGLEVRLGLPDRAMGRFLKENWGWILAPMVVIGLVLLIAIWVLADGDVPFSYALF
jgi:hypothetical protein